LKLEQAPLDESYDGWIYADGCGYNEGYFSSMDDLLDYLADTDRDSRPTRVWRCKEVPFHGPSIERIIEAISDAGFEGIEERLAGVDELQAALDKFNEVNAGLISYEPDHTFAVPVPAE
jgi:hypothetical protein